VPDSKVFPKHDQRTSKIVANQCRGPQSLDCIPALGDRLPRLVDHSLKLFLGFGRAIQNDVLHSMKLQQRALKTLQEGIV
jgi:hypothetical protein